MISSLVAFYFILLPFFFTDADIPCNPRNYGHDSVVCVCNSTYCDTITSTKPVPLNSVSVYTTTKSGQRFHFETVELNAFSTTADLNPTVIHIDTNTSYQQIKGFGGAVTDAATINIKSLSQKAQDNLLQSYFSSQGIEYNMGRVPIASCDYSTREYTYLDKPDDFNLTTFALAKEDFMYKIPVLQYILKIAAKPISLYASPWTAPAWMKVNDNEIGRGWLKGTAGDKYHKTWARYFTKFFDEYAKHGIKFWGATVQNEPSNGLLTSSDWQSTGYTAETERDFVKKDLGPELVKSGYGNIKLMILDDQRIFMPTWPSIVLSDKEAAKYVYGIGVHWYWNWVIGPEVLTDTHKQYPDTFILATEACNKNAPSSNLGSWETGTNYSNDVLDNLNNWAVGWVDWNMCLDLQGGPNWANNFDNSPIVVNASADEFYKQPMFYHLGHFSKFIPENSFRIRSFVKESSPLKFVSVITPSSQVVLIVLNNTPDAIPITVSEVQNRFNYTVPANAIQTFVWNA